MATDYITPVELAGKLDNQAPAVGFLTQFFKFSPEFLHGTEEFIIDKINAVTGVAVYVQRDGEFVKVKNDGYKTDKYKAGYIKEQKTVTSKDLRDRDAGVPNLLGKQNPGANLGTIIGKQFAQLENRVQRALELQAAQGLTTGVITMYGYDKDNSTIVMYEFDFKLDASHKITPTVLWSEVATAKPINDLEDAVQIITDEAATPATNIVVVMDNLSWRAFSATDQVTKALDNRRMEYGKIAPKMINSLGAKYQGEIKGVGEIWTYSRKYKDTNGAAQDYMTTKKVLVVDKDASFEEHYAVIENMKASKVGFKAKRFPMSIENENGQGITNTLECAPIMAPIQLEGVVVISPLA